MSTKNRPWMKFYPSDWQADDGLRQCSLMARGLWIEMIAIMHKSATYGHLLIAGVNPTVNQIAAAVRGDAKATKAGLEELESWNVFSRTDDGVIFSRRMVADAEKAERDAANGRDGGNPQLKPSNNTTVNGSGNEGVNPPHKAQIPEAREQIPEEERSFASLTPARAPAKPGFFEDWWREYPKKVGKDAARKSYDHARRRGATDADLIAALHRQQWPQDPRFIPNPATWLNQGRWQDDPTATVRAGSAPPPKPGSQAERDQLRAELDAILASPREAFFEDELPQGRLLQ